MKKQFYIFKSLILSIILFSGASLAMEQENKTFKGVVNNTNKEVGFTLGSMLKPLWVESIKPNTAKLVEIPLEKSGPGSMYSICLTEGQCIHPQKPKNNKFIILVEPLVHEGRVYLDAGVHKEIPVE